MLERKRKRSILEWCDNHLGLIFILPAMAILGLLIIYPLYFNINMSLHKVNMINFKADEWEFVGLKNYIANKETILASMGE